MPTLDWNTYCSEMVPTLLSEWGAEANAEPIGSDMMARAESFAQSGRNARDVLRAPFVEEVASYEPNEAPLSVLAAVCVVVRCSRLEEAHASGVVDDGGIRGLTSMAAAPLSQWLNEHYETELGPPRGVFAELDIRWPRAWAALDAMTRVPDGGRTGFQLPRTPVPPMPGDDELVTARRAPEGRNIVLSGIELGFDEDAIGLLTQADEGGFVTFVANLSRLSRNLDKMLRMLEILLSRGASVLTTNHLIRPGEIHTRRGNLVPPDTLDPMSGMQREDGLTGLHRKTLRSILDSVDETRV